MTRTTMILGLCLVLVAACGGSGPSFELENQVAAVGQTFNLELSASNESGNPIKFTYDSDAPRLSDRASLTERPSGTAVFSWTPQADDVGLWTFDFHATDAAGRTTESITIEVRSAVGANSLPVFRRPLGAGTSLDLGQKECVEFEIAVDDQDTTQVTIAEEEPRIEGTDFVQDGDREAVWRWCPTEVQIAGQDRYVLTLSADDGDNPKAIKRLQIILRDGEDKSSCSGEPPMISHTPQDHRTVDNLRIVAEVSDDAALKGTPLLYYTTEAVSDPPDLSRMVQLPMALKTGDDRSGSWVASVPNPVATQQAGASATVHYVIVAEDNDDRGGKCDHLVQMSYQAVVTHPGDTTMGEGGLCEGCVTDAQCGGADDLCMRVGLEGESFCLQGCDGPGTCPEGYICSPTEMESAEGGRARQCLPINESCTGTAVCRDDDREQNDGKSQATSLSPGDVTSLAMCPLGNLGGDEDWYQIDVTEDATVDFLVKHPATQEIVRLPDLNLRLFDESGRLIALSEDALDPFSARIQDVSRCLTPGTYYLQLYSYLPGERKYEIEYDLTPGECRASMCTDDVLEDDDNIANANAPSFEAAPAVRFDDGQICSGDDDYFFVNMLYSETLYVSLTFEQAAQTEDLDILIADGVGDLLTPCTEDNPTGCSFNGQSGTSNEYLTYSPADHFPPPSSGFQPFETYIIIHGWAGSQNGYDLCIALEQGHCELP